MNGFFMFFSTLRKNFSAVIFVVIGFKPGKSSAMGEWKEAVKL